MRLTPEGKVKKDVRAFLKEKGAWYYQPVQNGMGQVGIPDFICCYRGMFLAIETKAPGNLSRVTANQQRVIDEIKAHAGIAIVADSVASLIPVFDLLETI